jgi:hypothetical protein
MQGCWWHSSSAPRACLRACVCATQVEVFPHDTWQELELGEGPRAGAGAGAASAAKPSRWVSEWQRRHA